MSTKLDKLIDDMVPSQVIEKTLGRADTALNSFGRSRSAVDTWNEFTSLMAAFMLHLDKNILRLPSSFNYNDQWYWGKSAMVLSHLYGREGEKAAFEIARTGTEGGLYGILKAVAAAKAREYIDNEINARIANCWNSLSADEKLEMADEYVKKYGHLLPAEMTEGGAVRVRMNMPSVLKEHPYVAQKLRDAIRLNA
jgi:hypothetical protein